MRAFYNEREPYAAAWLSNLSQAGHIANGTIDSRSIKDVRPSDLAGFTQAHFFAGIGVWSHALRLAGWPDGFPVWTGSCPCQPFSGAGKGEGFADPRHLWPEWFRLIEQCRPPVILGEQVASPDGLAWLDLVSSDLEGSGYAFGAAVLPAAGVGAPHGRHRLFFVAHADGGPCGQRSQVARGGDPRGDAEPRTGLGCGSGAGWLGDSGGAGLAEQRSDGGAPREALGGNARETALGASAPTAGFWSDAEWIPCRDGKLRPVEPGTFPLAHGAAARVGRLRAYGNALCAPLAATFIQAVMAARKDLGLLVEVPS